VPQGRGIDHAVQYVAGDGWSQAGRNRPYGSTQKLERLIEPPLTKATGVERNRTGDVDPPLPLRSDEKRNEILAQGSRQLAMPTVLEA